MTFDPTVNFSFLLALASFLFAWWRTRDQNTDARFKAGSDRMDNLDHRLSSVEQTLRGMPGRDDIHQVQLSLTEMKGDLRAMQAAMAGTREIMGRLETIVTRHEEHLLEGSRK